MLHTIMVHEKIVNKQGEKPTPKLFYTFTVQQSNTVIKYMDSLEQGYMELNLTK